MDCEFAPLPFSYLFHEKISFNRHVLEGVLSMTVNGEIWKILRRGTYQEKSSGLNAK